MRITVATIITSLFSVLTSITATKVMISKDQWFEDRPKDVPGQVWHQELLMRHPRVQEITVRNGDTGYLNKYMLSNENYENRWLKPQTISNGDEHVVDWTFGYITVWIKGKTLNAVYPA
ncbi:hypothetical protein PCASD_20008 [Puccinia coronata f. sp. avenae]|uniref:Uncharacterized protein n=1 Tax=Puccinia coronata f. sp. avenae TaxID=200324 RepID=A0A2N5SCB6_9BASI|nr:hypothetical protein PCASD_20008 [Puccinia coronata f. sp. avenae]